MPKRSNIYTSYDKHPIVLRSGKRIRIPQPVIKDITLFSGDAVKREQMGRSAAWFTLHHRGMKRPFVGADPLEIEAVSPNAVRGTLPERIMFKSLVNFGFVPGADFDFQSSQNGGRLELGGIVSDYLFYNLHLVIQVEGPFHKMFLQSKRDDEQDQILADMGYDVVRFYEWEVYNRAVREDKIRRVFGFARSSGRSFYQAEKADLQISEWDNVVLKIQSLIDLAVEAKSAWQI